MGSKRSEENFIFYFFVQGKYISLQNKLSITFFSFSTHFESVKDVS